MHLETEFGPIPKDLVANLWWRETVLSACRYRQVRDAVFLACGEDFELFLNGFCWLYEPRPMFNASGEKLPEQIPFITWPHQDKMIREILPVLGVKDIGVEKSRTQGVSWIATMTALWEWCFHPGSKINMVSRNEKMGDNPQNPDSLFWKIDWQMKKLPRWMIGFERSHWRRSVVNHFLANLRHDAWITSEAATGDVGRGGRCKWQLVDELAFFDRPSDEDAMASIQQTTHSRWVISTPNGQEGAYFNLMHEPSSMLRCVLDWKDNPTQNQGLYRYDKGDMIELDPQNPLPRGYREVAGDIHARLIRKGFYLEGSIRSPWYDSECDRPSASSVTIARELDRNYGGSLARIFDDRFQSCAQKTIRGCTVQGMIHYSNPMADVEFRRESHGLLRLWMPLDSQMRPRNHLFVVGADICSGIGGDHTSNSAIEIIDLITMEQVGELVVNTMLPHEFADLCIAICRWLGDSFLIWERNGPGQAFTRQVLQRRYANIYYRKSILKRSKRTKEPGWWMDRNTKEACFSELDLAVKSEELQLRSRELKIESTQYVRIDGNIEHVQAKRTSQDASKGEAHGDRVVAICMALQGAKDRPMKVRSEVKREIPPYSMAARMEAWDRQKNRDRDWDDRPSLVQ
jgi:hypothetical protein